MGQLGQVGVQGQGALGGGMGLQVGQQNATQLGGGGGLQLGLTSQPGPGLQQQLTQQSGAPQLGLGGGLQLGKITCETCK